jgi:hypothetical protein
LDAAGAAAAAAAAGAAAATGAGAAAAGAALLFSFTIFLATGALAGKEVPANRRAGFEFELQAVKEAKNKKRRQPRTNLL